LEFFDGIQPVLQLLDLLAERVVDHAVLLIQKGLDLLDGEPGQLKIFDLHKGQGLLLLIPAIPRPGVYLSRLQKILVVVVSEGLRVALA
jgi:hypothetical protein